MRKLLVLTAMAALSLCARAQKNKNDNPDLPPFGEVSKADLQMKNCDFDDNAEALVLVDDGVLEYVMHQGLQLKRRIRIKILNSKGLEWANVHLPYMSEKKSEDISGLDAQTYNIDAAGTIQVAKLDKKLVYEKKLNKRYTEKVFTFPEVKVGSIIEYKFKHTNVGLIDWYFQRSIPVRYSHFSIEVPSDFEVSAIPYCAHQYTSDRKLKAATTLTSYSMSKVPGLRSEPYTVNEDYYRDRLETKVTAYRDEMGRMNRRIVNWMQVIKALMEDEDFGVQIKKNIPRTQELDQKLTGITSEYDRMKIIYKYVQDNMEWNEYSGIWAADGVKAAWKDHKGTVGEINLILVNLLKDAGLDAHPILVSTHNYRIVNTVDAGTYEAPGFLQFNKVMAHVMINNKMYILDGSQKNTPPHLIPADVIATQGLVISKIETFDWGWTTLTDDRGLAKNVCLISGKITESGQLEGTSTVTSFDYERLARLPIAKKGQDKFIARYVTDANPGMTVKEVAFENMDKDSLPLVQTMKFTMPLNSAGEYQYFTANLLTGLEQNPFVADTRASDVFFGCNRSFLVVGNFELPAGYEFETPPKNIKMIMPDTSIIASRISEVNGGLLQLRMQVDFKKPVYPADQYGDLQEFYKSLFDMINEQFVIRKKAK